MSVLWAGHDLYCFAQQVQVRFEVAALNLNCDVAKKQLSNVNRCTRARQIARYSCNATILDSERALYFGVRLQFRECVFNAAHSVREIGFHLVPTR